MSDAAPDVAEAPDKVTLQIPPGYGLKILPAADRAERLLWDDDAGLFDILLLYEPPRRGHLYVLSVDVSGGMGADRSVIEVTRAGNLYEGEEQVAQFVSSTVDPIDLAYLIAPIGYLYKGSNGLPAVVAIECNFGLGLGTQSELLRHVGYENLFIWQVEDSVDQDKRFRNSFGWYTNGRTRPMILQRYFHAIKTVDKHSGEPDYKINSPHTIMELADFQTAGAIWDGEAAPGAHDDTIMAGAIGLWVAHTLHQESREPLSETRHRLAEEKSRALTKADRLGRGVNHQTMDCTTEEISGSADGDVIDMISADVHYL
jgi:hypothetical protein